MSMRIGIVSTSFPRYQGDSAGGFIYGLAKHLVIQGHRVCVVAPMDADAKYSESLEGITVRRFAYMFPQKWQRLCYGAGIPENVRKHPWTVLQIPLLMISAFIETWKISGKCDVLHAFWSLPGFIALVVGRIRKKPVVVTLMGVEVFVDSLANRLLSRWVIENVNIVIAISEYTRLRILAIATPKQCEVIPFGIESKIQRDPNARRKLHQQLELPPDIAVVFALGRLVKRKGFEYLVRAMRIVTRQVPAHLVIGGSGPCREELAMLAEQLGIQDVVHLLGYVEAADLPTFFQGSDVFVLPSIMDGIGDTEGLGMVLLEAQVSGCPVVASRIGGILDIVKDAQTGLLATPGSPVELSEKIIALLQNSDLRRSVANAGRMQAETEFDWDIVTQRIACIYRKEISRSHDGA